MTGVDYRDHKRAAAMQTSQGHERGWNFSAVPAEPSFSDRLADIVFKPATWISLGILALTVSLFWIA